jgi:hypothetical protein
VVVGGPPRQPTQTIPLALQARGTLATATSAMTEAQLGIAPWSSVDAKGPSVDLAIRSERFRSAKGRARGARLLQRQ